jgi:hypothetical protein
MSAAHLDEPVTASGNAFVHFFNGRLLTGEDLSREQDANRRARSRLGLAAGSGVVAGLDVAPSQTAAADESPAVTVEAGLAVNALGQALELPGRTDVSLVQRPTAPGAVPPVLFRDCTPPQPETYTTGAGVYLLSIGPASAQQGRAPVSGLGNGGAACNTAYSLDGVRFRLLRLSLPVASVASAPLLRNRVAHLMLGTGDPVLDAFAGDPWGAIVQRWGMLDALRAGGCLPPEEVPLALLRWTGAGGLVFVDRWSVRRRLTRGDVSQRWPLLLSDRLGATAEAVFHQFQDQVDELRVQATAAVTASPPDSTSAIRAVDRFAFLPPAGILPVVGRASPLGFDATTFFGDQASRDVALLDAAQLRPLLEESLAHDPIPVDEGGEKVQLYSVRENADAVAAGATSQLVVVFARQTLRFRGAARYGMSAWGSARTAQAVV